MLSSTNGDLLADEIVTDNPNPQLATPVDVEIVEETKYMISLRRYSDILMLGYGSAICISICEIGPSYQWYRVTLWEYRITVRLQCGSYTE